MLCTRDVLRLIFLSSCLSDIIICLIELRFKFEVGSELAISLRINMSCEVRSIACRTQRVWAAATRGLKDLEGNRRGWNERAGELHYTSYVSYLLPSACMCYFETHRISVMRVGKCPYWENGSR